MKKIPMLEKFAAQSLVESDGELIFSKEKFAELIVRECIGCCDKQTPNWKGEYATAFGDGVEFCISGIKEHFGVEE